MTEVKTFTCGHSAAIPRHLGRGLAREVRMNAYFNRRCIDCAMAHATAYCARFTDSAGRPASADYILRKTQEWYQRIRKTY